MIRVTFWGTRGSIASPGSPTQRYGGNTSCVQVTGFQSGEPGAAMRPGNSQIILDGGTGLVSLGTALMAGPGGREQRELHLLLSHYHWDHLIGIPFFGPMRDKGRRVVFYGSSVRDVRSSIQRLFASAYNPLQSPENVAADLAYRRVERGGMQVAGFQVRAAENLHPGGSLSFRLQYGRQGVVYTTDHTAGDPGVDGRLLDLARGAQLWIVDAMFTPEELERYSDWGHNSHINAVQLALDAGVETVVLFHHDPGKGDRALDRVGKEAAETAAGTRTQVLMARDGMVVEVGGTLHPMKDESSDHD